MLDVSCMYYGLAALCGTKELNRPFCASKSGPMRTTNVMFHHRLVQSAHTGANIFTDGLWRNGIRKFMIEKRGSSKREA